MKTKVVAGVFAAVAASGLLITPGATAAEAAATSPGSIYKGTDGWCHYKYWGGNFYCKSNYERRLPDGRIQAFVIGTRGWVFAIQCKGLDHNRWGTTRNIDGKWSNRYRTY
ncbi:hypothetical protein AB0D14_41425 [Streptomyces sp. NPDC048484]|uniref:hypothetical protein n=1 Tax=Streptomyces sp. NPDC048484 TaxID=3155146 RepID=UPI003445E9A0